MDGDLAVAAAWTPHPLRSDWRTCGDLVIATNDLDPLRYVVQQDGAIILSGRIPPSGWTTFDVFLRDLRASAEEYEIAIPADGLESWFDTAQLVVDELIEAEQAERTERTLLGRTAEELLAEEPEEISWLVTGVIPERWSGVVQAREKTGKGTLVYYLLGKAERGEDSVFGATKQTTAYIVTEEPPESVREKVDLFGLRRSRVVYGFELTASAPTWEQKVAQIVAEATAEGHGIVFLDNISRSARVEKEEGVELTRAVELLQEACRNAGLTFISDHHHKKGRDAIENKGRGGTGFAGAVDVIIDMERVGGRESRKRRLTSRGRLRATLWTRLVELSEDGTDYALLADDDSEPGDRDGGSRAASSEEQLTADLLTLRQAGLSTIEAFAARIGRSKDTAARRLSALVEAGLAEVVGGGENTPSGRTPLMYAPKPEPNRTPNRREDAVGAVGLSGVENPA